MGPGAQPSTFFPASLLLSGPSCLEFVNLSMGQRQGRAGGGHRGWASPGFDIISFAYCGAEPRQALHLPALGSRGGAMAMSKTHSLTFQTPKDTFSRTPDRLGSTGVPEPTSHLVHLRRQVPYSHFTNEDAGMNK